MKGEFWSVQTNQKPGMKINTYTRLLSGWLTFIALTWSCEEKQAPTPTNGGTGSGGSSSGGVRAQTGTATFFSKEDLGVGDVVVHVEGTLAGTISHYHSGGVTCGKGDVNIEKPAGVYKFKATGGNQVWEGTITIVNGRCQSHELLKSSGTSSAGGTGGSTAQGQATFWTAQTSGWSYIDISVEGTNVGRISKSYSSAPACGANGCVTINKTPGTYVFTAQSDKGDKWSDQVSISANSCSKKQLTFTATSGGGGGSSGTGICNWSSALQCAKIVAKKGTRCGEATSLDVTITNGCTVPVKFYVCIQNADGKWIGNPDGTFEAGLAPGKSANWYSCKTTNQYKYGAMTAADFVKNKCGYPKCN